MRLRDMGPPPDAGSVVQSQIGSTHFRPWMQLNAAAGVGSGFSAPAGWL
jgi:hypothetical protein